MSVQKSDAFITDVEGQYEWYAVKANLDIAERYLRAIEATCRLLNQYPMIGPPAGFTHQRLITWRFIVVFRPFNKHVIFYEMTNDDVVSRRAMHGHRNFPKNLI
jgi:plasmid stabilization system protein ParE